MKKLNYKIVLAWVLISILSWSCSDDDIPEAENEEEIITDVTLTFSPTAGGNDITALAQDPDGEGPKELEIAKNIELMANTSYTLTLALENSIAGESITEEVEAESDEHMFFFGWTDGLFSNPTGDGNIGTDQRNDPVNYDDSDENAQPVGLITSWTTGDAGYGTFQVILKHQPGIKSATSTSADGESDVDITWDITIQ